MEQFSSTCLLQNSILLSLGWLSPSAEGPSAFDFVEVPHRKESGPPPGLSPGNYFQLSVPAIWASFHQGFRPGCLLVQTQASIRRGRAASVLPNIWRKQRLGSRKDLNWQGGVGMGNTKGPPGRSVQSQQDQVPAMALL